MVRVNSSLLHKTVNNICILTFPLPGSGHNANVIEFNKHQTACSFVFLMTQANHVRFFSFFPLSLHQLNVIETLVKTSQAFTVGGFHAVIHASRFKVRTLYIMVKLLVLLYFDNILI